MAPSPSFLRKSLFACALTTFLPLLSHALPPPPPLEELCKESDVIVRGHFVGGDVGPTTGCEFSVTFQVKPDEFYKKPDNLMEKEVIQYTRRYFVDTDQCRNLPGPNAMPGQMTVDLQKPTSEQKVFFLKNTQGQLKNLTDAFWSITQWNQAPKEWHQQFKNTPACHGS